MCNSFCGNNGGCGFNIWWIIILAVLFTLPTWGGNYIVMLVMLMGMYITLGHMWNLLSGYSGLTSLGSS